MTVANGAVWIGLTYTFSGRASGANDLAFLNAGSPGVFTYTSTAAANGYDANVPTQHENSTGVVASGEPGVLFLPFKVRFSACIRDSQAATLRELLYN